MGFSRRKYSSRLPFPSPGDLSKPGIKLGSPALQVDSLLSEQQEAQGLYRDKQIKMKSLRSTLMQNDLWHYKKEKFGRGDSTEGRRYKEMQENTTERWRQGLRLVSHTTEYLGYQKLKDTGRMLVFRRCMIPLTPWLRNSNLQNCKIINVCGSELTSAILCCSSKLSHYV